MAKFGDYAGGFHTLTWRLGDTVQNLVSPRISGRVDSTASEGGFPHVWAVQWFLAQATTCLSVESLSLVISSLCISREKSSFRWKYTSLALFIQLNHKGPETILLSTFWLDSKQNETTAPFSFRYKQQNFWTWGARKTAGVASAQTLNC